MGLPQQLTHSDPVIQEVLNTWTPRFTRGGIALGDIIETVARMDSWDDWVKEWMATGAFHEARAVAMEADGFNESAAETFVIASRCYHLAYFVSTRDPEMHEAGLAKMLETHDRALPHLRPAIEKVEFEADGIRCVGLLSTPAGDGPHPMVILLPGLDSTKETRHGGRGRWIARGVAVLSMDGPGQGEASRWSVCRPDYEVAITAAVDWAETHAEIDAARIGVIGSSLAGYYAPRAAAFEHRTVATVANCGPYDWGACFSDLPTVTREAFQQYAGCTTMEEAQERANSFTLEGVAGQITKPLIVFHGDVDPLIPWQDAKRLADESGAECVIVENGNHGLSNKPYEWIPRSIDWMCGHLGV